MLKKLLCTALCNLAICCSASAETSLWVVRAGDALIYLGGTCHLLRSTDYPLPEAFDEAYAEAQRIVFEADPGELAGPQVQQALAHRSLYPEGVGLDRILSPATYGRLQDHCRRHNLPLAALNRLKPPMLALSLLAIELQRTGVTTAGADFHYYDRAVAERKPTAALETAAQQVDFILAMGEGEEDAFVAYALEDMERLPVLFDRLVAAWRGGDEEELAELILAGEKTLPDLYRSLYSDRNATWLPLIEKLLQTPETELVLVGVGHLVGDDGLLAALKRRGYAVEKVP